MKRIASVVLGAGIGAAALGGTAAADMGHGVWSSPGTAAPGQTVTVTTHCEGSAALADITGDAFVHGAKGAKVDINGHASALLVLRSGLGSGEYELRAECLDEKGSTDKTGTVTVVAATPDGGAAAGFGGTGRTGAAVLGAAAVALGAVTGALALLHRGRAGA